jgi:hypothetical protein
VILFTRKQSQVACFQLVTAAGFEPATFGL